MRFLLSHQNLFFFYIMGFSFISLNQVSLLYYNLMSFFLYSTDYSPCLYLDVHRSIVDLLIITFVIFFCHQVNNRDISIAVMRTFISKRNQEHEAMLSKRTTSAPKVSEKDGEEEAPDESVVNENSNCEIERPAEISQDEPCCISEEAVKPTERNVLRQLKPPRVLEVSL